jgi:hypothetical protein
MDKNLNNSNLKMIIVVTVKIINEVKLNMEVINKSKIK